MYGADPVPITEESPVGMGIANPYGRTKYMMEQVLTDLSVADKEWSVILLRFFNPVGAHESGEIGESPNGIPNNLMPYIQQVAIGRRPFLSVFGNDYPTPDGTGVRDYIHIYDLAQGHLKAVEYLFGKMEHGTEVFNLGTGHGHSVLESWNEREGVMCRRRRAGRRFRTRSVRVARATSPCVTRIRRRRSACLVGRR